VCRRTHTGPVLQPRRARKPRPRWAGGHPQAENCSPGGPRKPLDRWAGRPRQPHV
ncbi:hypothetical protein NDU88_001366, partial [Pleurodeles waltl]